MSELTAKEREAIQKIEQKPALQPFFFKRIKELKWFNLLWERGFFDYKSYPKYPTSDESGQVYTPTWHVLFYLEKIAPMLEYEANNDYALRVLEIIRNISDKSARDGNINTTTWWFFSKIISYIPANLLNQNDARLVRIWLNNGDRLLLVGSALGERFLPNLLNANSENANIIALSIIDAMTEVYWHEREIGGSVDKTIKLKVDDYHAEKIFKQNGISIGKNLKTQGIDIFRNRIEEILSKTSKDQYSSIWRPAIEEHQQNIGTEKSLNILISAFRDSTSGYAEYAIAKDYIKSLLESPYYIIRRVAIFVIGQYSKALSELIDLLIIEDYFNYHYQHEMYHFLSKIYEQINQDNKSTVLNIIENVSAKHIDADLEGDVQRKQKAYAALRWLSAIQGKGHPETDQKYNEYLKITGHAPSHPDFSSYMESGWVGEESPYTVKDLLSRDTNELLDLIASFREEFGWKKPTRAGLAGTLKEAIKTKPDYFRCNLFKFKILHHDYIYKIIDAYKELWLENQHDNWHELLEFCWGLISEKDFWIDGPKDDSRVLVADYNWTVSSIAELIRAGTREDKTSFDPKHLDQARKILVHILDNQPGEEFPDTFDAVSVSINCARGKTIEALINYSLRLCRLADSNNNDHSEIWQEKICSIFNKELNLIETGNYEFVTLFANYIPNLLYMSKEWTLNTLPIIFDPKREKHWQCAMQGYAYVNTVYQEIYEFLAAGHHLTRALDTNELENTTHDKVVQNIVLAYIHFEGELPQEADSVDSLIDRWNYSELSHMIWFIWTQRKFEKVIIDNKILPLWTKLAKHSSPKNKDDRKILAKLSLWSVFVDDLDYEILNLLKVSAPYANEDFDEYILIEELARLVDTHTEQVSEIYLEMIEGAFPRYEEDNIKYILERMWKYGRKPRERANYIIDKYLEAGIEFPALIKSNSMRASESST